MDLTPYLRDVPDFPKPGILFKDITPLLADGAAFRATIDAIAALYPVASFDTIVGVESRGFIFGAALAAQLGKGFVPVRKPGKLPYKTRREEYALEYGTDALEIHEDAFARGGRALIVDDVLATGGTLAATARLVEAAGGTVAGLFCAIELGFLGGRAKLAGYPFQTLLVINE